MPVHWHLVAQLRIVVPYRINMQLISKTHTEQGRVEQCRALTRTRNNDRVHEKYKHMSNRALHTNYECAIVL